MHRLCSKPFYCLLISSWCVESTIKKPVIQMEGKEPRKWFNSEPESTQWKVKFVMSIHKTNATGTSSANIWNTGTTEFDRTKFQLPYEFTCDKECLLEFVIAVDQVSQRNNLLHITNIKFIKFTRRWKELPFSLAFHECSNELRGNDCVDLFYLNPNKRKAFASCTPGWGWGAVLIKGSGHK